MSAAKRRKVTADGPPVVPPAKRKCDVLYDHCVEKKPIGEAFSPAELLEMDVARDDVELQALCQELLDCFLFVLYNKREGAVEYRLRPKEEALKLSKLSEDSFMVYSRVAGTGRSGIWKKTIVSKSRLHENTVTKCIKELTGKKLIKEFKSIKNPSKKMYILHELEPSEDTTGGNFYKDGDLDEGLVNTLGDFIVRWVEDGSWMEQKIGPPEKSKVERRKKPDKDASAPHTSEHDELMPRFQTPFSIHGYPLIPRPPSFTAYPTAAEAHGIIVGAQLVKDMSLDVEDVQQLMQQLVFQDRLEEMPHGGYRSVRRIVESNASLERMSMLNDDGDGLAPGDALGEIPCGACPVESECRVGGIVSPETCVYMDKWLEF